MLSDIQFSQKVLGWYEQFGRHDLPWQLNRSPYRVWISEIMLQQTQVSTVIPYYERFMNRFPSVQSLAESPVDEVLNHWSGLGYYARARNLHKTAKLVHSDFNDEFPKTVLELSQLPGIGRSTAGAILSLALDIPASILDGNVKRVLARFAAIKGWPGNPKVQEVLWGVSERYTPVQSIQPYNQAMMDIGATICTRTKPQCHACPLSYGCEAYLRNEQSLYPHSKPKSKSKPQKSIYFLIFENKENGILFERRPPTGIWGGLWSFPECPGDQNVNKWCEEKFACKITQSEEWSPFKHSFSHFDLIVQPIRLSVKFKSNHLAEDESKIWLKIGDKLPGGLAAPVQKILTQLGF